MSDFVLLTNVVGWTLIHFLWQGTVVAALLVLANAVIGSRRANLRYAVSCASLALLAALPIATAWSLSRSLDPDALSPAPLMVADISTALFEPFAIIQETVSVNGSTSISAEQIEQVLPWIVQLWLIGAAVFLARMAGGWRHLQSVRSSSVPIAHPQWQGIVLVHAHRMGIRTSVQLLESARIAVPAVVGWLRPAILVPIGLFAGMSPQHIEAVLVHELAHISRYDSLVNLLQAAVESLLFFHPAVWWVSRRIRSEREFCCDDTVISICGEPAEYARALSVLGERRNALLAVAVSGGGLLSRIQRLLRIEPRGFPRGWPAPAFAVSLAATLLVVSFSSFLVLRDRAVQTMPAQMRTISPVSRLRLDPQGTPRPAQQPGD